VSVALFSQCSLVRNLADFPFPKTCSDDEESLIEERIVRALDMIDPQWHGQYFSFSFPESRDGLFWAECRLVPLGSCVPGKKHCGVFVTEDQSIGVTVNGIDHICLTAVSSGLQLAESWERVNSLDDALVDVADYAFDRELGYLTSSLAHVGTGLKVSVVLHLPGLAMSDGLASVFQAARDHHHAFSGLEAFSRARRSSEGAGTGDGDEPEARIFWGDFLYYGLSETNYTEGQEPASDLYVLANRITLGRSEEEILFHLRHEANSIIALERAARERLLKADERLVRDRVARALGLSRSVQLLEVGEALSLLSAIRLGIETGLVEAYSLQMVDELYITCQDAHLKMRVGRECDERTLSVARADPFRARFGQDRKG